MKSLWIIPGDNSAIPNPISDVNPQDNRVTIDLVHNILLPLPENTQVLVSVKTCAISRIPRKLIKPSTNGAVVRYPLGYEISGMVLETGPDVKRLKKEDEVVGVLPYDTTGPGCATHVLVSEMFLVHKPDNILHTDCCSLLKPGLQAYTALYVLGRLQKDDVILICEGASPAALVCIQLAHSHCSKIITTVSNGEEAEYVLSEIPFQVTIIDLSTQGKTGAFICLKETGGLGVNLIIDFGIKMDESLTQHIKNSEYIEVNSKFVTGIFDDECSIGFTEECYALSLFKKKIGLTKNQILSSLSLGGRWVTSQDNIQLDPPDTHTLFMKGASISFLFTDLWSLSGFNQGKYLHILSSLMGKLEANTIAPSRYNTVGFEALTDAIINEFNFDNSTRLIISLD
ncbi:Quinone oxidoreductase-like protein 1 isoform X1 [Oopsacas minuta]|uniref:Quinone oxidoreductase-like protein 1 isoform X1 n=1 Tax=Oopsacas minuta TaxID=111878 RepID=A0AAV7K0D1_9METZ|nr:Quinone oxidoreductase-like protein 1 isoform X1 [Oopsacas minuta]